MVLVLTVIVLLSVIFFVSNSQSAKSFVTIRMSSTGFEPKILIIQKGTKVVFKNIDKSPHWPASDVHPLHHKYPGTGIEKCGITRAKNAFDACGVAPREDFSFVFNVVGNWTYHDHLKPFLGGEIRVVE